MPMKRMFEDEPTTYDDDGLGGWQSVGSVQKPRDPNKPKKNPKSKNLNNITNINNNNNNVANSGNVSASGNSGGGGGGGEGFRISFEQDFHKNSKTKLPSKSKITRQKLKNKRVKKSKLVIPVVLFSIYHLK